MTSRIAVVGTDPSFYSELDADVDSPLLVEALRRRGVEAEAVSWHDDSVDWSGVDLAVLRSPWDYPLDPEGFSRWLEKAGEATTVQNPPALVRWNMDKRYLAQLALAGVPVVPTTYHEDEASLQEGLAALDAEHVVVKPAVGAGSLHTGLFAREDPALLGPARAILSGGGTVLLQPEVTELSEGAEKAVYLVDGRVTHAISKGALLARGGGLRGGVYQEHPELVEVSAAEAALAEQVVAAAGAVTGAPLPLYARIDMVDSAAFGLVLLEAELFEPTFNLHLVPEVTEIFAEAVLARA